ncbi:MAG: LamG-like jellyroll fold domain-containing protein, partial [Armatimonadota bacterium]
MVPFALVACAQYLAAPAEATLAFEAVGLAVELHNGAQIAVDGDRRVLRLDAARQQYATLAPEGDIFRDGIHLEARVRFAKHAAGGHPVGRKGMASLYVDSGGRPWFIFWSGGEQRILQDERRLSLNEWHHLVADYRVGGYVELIVDGIVVIRAPAPGPLDESDSPWLVGRWDWIEDGEEKHAYMTADVDELRIGPPRGRLRWPDDPRPRLIQHFSWGDMILSGEADTRRKIRQTLEQARARGVEKVHWRISAAILREDHQRAPRDKWAPYIREYYDIVDRVFEQMDPIAEAIEVGHTLGLQMYGWLTIYDEGAPPDVLYADDVPFPWQSKFTAAHPEYLVVDREGKPQWGVLEYAYPEARRYKANQIARYLRRYDLDGVFISTRSHSPPAMHGDRFGFNEPVVAAYEERFGKDILREGFDREAWRRLRG